MNDARRQTWLISGVSSGLGRALAQAALNQGDVVAGTVRKESDQSEFESLAPGRALGFLLDVTDEKSVQKIVAEAEGKTGGIDILVNNAGYGLMGAIEETSLAEIRAQFEVNVFGAIAMIQALLPSMRRKKAGHIINITSVSGLATWEGTGIYCASKFALEAIGQTLASELAPLGVNVTNIEPGGLRTDFAGRSMAIAAKEISAYKGTAHQSRRIMDEHAGHEPGDPQKAADAIVALAGSDEPPLQLLLGADAMFYIGTRLGAFHAEMAKWAPTTLSIAFDGSES